MLRTFFVLFGDLIAVTVAVASSGWFGGVGCTSNAGPGVLAAITAALGVVIAVALNLKSVMDEPDVIDGRVAFILGALPFLVLFFVWAATTSAFLAGGRGGECGMTRSVAIWGRCQP